MTTLGRSLQEVIADPYPDGELVPIPVHPLYGELVSYPCDYPRCDARAVWKTREGEPVRLCCDCAAMLCEGGLVK